MALNSSCLTGVPSIIRRVDMPLHKGRSKKTVSKNISMMMHEGKPRDQAIAIAMRKAGMPKMKKDHGFYGHVKIQRLF